MVVGASASSPFPICGRLLTAAKNASAKNRTDVLLVKSCYLATLEAAREIDNLTEYLICSQARVPLRTWSIWEEVFDELHREPEGVVKSVMHAIDVHYEDVAERNGRAEIPFSLLKPGGVREFVDGPMAALSGYIADHLDDARIAMAIEAARPPAGGDKALLDVRTLLANLINIGDPDLAAIAAALDRAIKPYVVVESTPAVSAFGGLGLFHFPRVPLLRAESFANKKSLKRSHGELLFCQERRSGTRDRLPACGRRHCPGKPVTRASSTPKPVGN